MNYSITIEITPTKYGSGVKSEASLDVENLHPTTLEQIVKAMVFDAEKKSLLKFKQAEAPEAPAKEPSEPL